MPFSQYTVEWRDEVNRLADQVFGKGYFVQPRKIAEEPGSAMVLHHQKKKLMGFAKGRLLPKKGLQRHLDFRVPEVPPDILAADGAGTLGVIETVAVDPAKRGKGIGYKLLRALHDDLVGAGADKLIITFKRGPSASNVDGLMARLGFEQWTRLPSYWRERCEAGDFDCIDRHNGCTCEALLFRKAVY